MNEEQFQRLVSEIMGKIDHVPGSNMDLLMRMAKQRGVPEVFRESITSLESSLGTVRLILGYLMLDLEATRRERDRFRTTLEDQL